MYLFFLLVVLDINKACQVLIYIFFYMSVVFDSNKPFNFLLISFKQFFELIPLSVSLAVPNVPECWKYL